MHFLIYYLMGELAIIGILIKAIGLKDPWLIPILAGLSFIWFGLSLKLFGNEP